MKDYQKVEMMLRALKGVVLDQQNFVHPAPKWSREDPDATVADGGHQPRWLQDVFAVYALVSAEEGR